VYKFSPFVVAALVASFGWSAVSADMVGQKLPSSTLNFVGSKPDMDGKPLLLEFWATWCPPCRTSIPHLNEIHAKYKDRGLLVVGVTGEPNAVIKKFQKEVPMDYAVATDTGGRLNEKMGISGIPHAFLVNKSGEIVWQGHPNRLTDADIEKILE
jgi:cytochrome c biogenesis protein CcmG/thiol:disulfide interchange protein DsbE